MDRQARAKWLYNNRQCTVHARLLVDDRNGTMPVTKKSWYVGNGDLTGALHVLRFPAFTTSA